MINAVRNPVRLGRNPVRFVSVASAVGSVLRSVFVSFVAFALVFFLLVTLARAGGLEAQRQRPNRTEPTTATETNRTGLQPDRITTAPALIHQ